MVVDNQSLRHRQSDSELATPLMHEEGNNDAHLSNDTNSLDDGSHHHHQHTRETRLSNLYLGPMSNLCSATLGAGALSLPYAISLTGIVVGVIFLLLSAYLTIISINIIIEACVTTQLYKFEDVSKRLVGSSLSFALEASLLIFCFGTAIAYIVAVGDILDLGFHSITFLCEPGSKLMLWYSRERVMILFWAVIMLPLSLQTKLQRLEKFSSLGVLSIIFLVIACVIHSIIHGDAFEKREISQASTPEVEISSLLWPKSFIAVLQAAPIIIFAFSCQVNVCAIYEELKPVTCSIVESSDVVPTLALLKSKELMMKGITRKAILLCMSLYLLIGVFGYLDFANTTTDDILVNYCIHITHDCLMTAATFSVFVALIVAFPFNIFPARVTLKLIFDRIKTKKGKRLCTTVTSFLPRFDVNENEQSISASLEIDAALQDLQDSTIHPLLEDGRLASVVEHVLITFLLSGGALLGAIFCPGISIVFGLMGGTAASTISFVIPGYFALKMEGSTSSVGNIFVCGGLVVGILTTGTTLSGVFNTGNLADERTC